MELQFRHSGCGNKENLNNILILSKEWEARQIRDLAQSSVYSMRVLGSKTHNLPYNYFRFWMESKKSLDHRQIRQIGHCLSLEEYSEEKCLPHSFLRHLILATLGDRILIYMDPSPDLFMSNMLYHWSHREVVLCQ